VLAGALEGKIERGELTRGSSAREGKATPHVGKGFWEEPPRRA